MPSTGCSKRSVSRRSVPIRSLKAEAPSNPHPNPYDSDSREGAEKRLIFAVAAVLGEAECFARGPGFQACADSRKKQWNARSIFVECQAIAGAQVAFLIAHHGGIENGKISD